MKKFTVVVLAASVMLVSQPSFAYGDLLFGALLKKTMTDERMISVAPKSGRLPWDEGKTVVLPLDVVKHRCSADTYIAAAQAQLTDKELTALDKYCRGKLSKTGLSSSAAAIGFGVTSSMNANCVRPGGKTDEDCARHNAAADIAATPPAVTTMTCMGANRKLSKDHVPYNGGWAHKACVPQ